MTAALSEPAPRHHALGIVLVLCAGLLWSSAGSLVRAIEQADPWQILFFKNVWMVAAIAAWLIVRYRGGVVAVARRGGAMTLIAGLCLVGANAGWLFSITSTSVANTLLLQAATPLIAALLAFAMLGERVGRATWIAMVVALAGVGVMVGDGALDGRLFGNAMGLFAMVSFAGFAVALRARRDADMTAALCVAGLLGALLSVVMAGDLGMTAWDHVVCFFMGTAETGLGLVLFTLGARFVPAGELVLLTLTEIFLGPLFVWLLFAEVPTPGTLAGGALVIAAIAGQAIIGFGRER